MMAPSCFSVTSSFGAVADHRRVDTGLVGDDTACLLDVDENLVGRKVFQTDDDPLRAVDDEVASWVVRVLARVDQLLLRHLGELAEVRLDHHRKVADVLPGRLTGHPLLLDGHVQVDRGRVGEIPEPGLHREDVADRTVYLDDPRPAKLDLAELDLVRGADSLDLDVSDLVDDRLQPFADELVVAVEVLPRDALLLEEVLQDNPRIIRPSDLLAHRHASTTYR